MRMKDIDGPLKTARMPVRKTLNKLGTVKINVVETTPVVWEEKLLRFEWIRNSSWGGAGGVSRSVGCYHFVDMENEESLGEFAYDHSFGCCYAENGKMYVHGTRGSGGGNVLDTFVSSDLKTWEQSTALVFPEDVGLFNTSVCKGDGKYVMAIEVSAQEGYDIPQIGHPFTSFFAQSETLSLITISDDFNSSLVIRLIIAQVCSLVKLAFPRNVLFSNPLIYPACLAINT